MVFIIATLSNIIDEVDGIVNSNIEVNFTAETRFKNFIPEEYMAVCYQVDSDEQSRSSLGQSRPDNDFSLNVFVVDRLPANANMRDFREKIEGIRDNISGTNDLNNRVTNLNVDVQYKDRGIKDNIEAIAKIQITGTLRNP